MKNESKVIAFPGQFAERWTRANRWAALIVGFLAALMAVLYLLYVGGKFGPRILEPTSLERAFAEAQTLYEDGSHGAAANVITNLAQHLEDVASAVSDSSAPAITESAEHLRILASGIRNGQTDPADDMTPVFERVRETLFEIYEDEGFIDTRGGEPST